MAGQDTSTIPRHADRAVTIALMTRALRLDPRRDAELLGRRLREVFEYEPDVAADEAFYSRYLERCPSFERGWHSVPAGSVPRRWDATTIVANSWGFGDQIQWFRLLPGLPATVQHVLVKSEVARIAASILGPRAGLLTVVDHDPWVAAQVDPPLIPAGALQLDLLPTLSGLRVGDLSGAPYIHPDPGAIKDQAARIGPSSGRLRVGVVWAARASSVFADHGPERTIGLELLAPLARVRGIRWYSLQKGPTEADPAPPGMDLVRLGPGFRDFSDTAAAMACLDLVVTVDTSVAHLAGAVGVPTWLLLRNTPDPRWLIGTPGPGQTAWYDSMCIVHQQRAGDWAPVVAQVAAELERLMASRRVA